MWWSETTVGLFLSPLQDRPCPWNVLCAQHTKENGFGPDQKKQIKIIYYNIKLFMILLNQKRAYNFKKLGILRPKRKKSERGERDDRSQ